MLNTAGIVVTAAVLASVSHAAPTLETRTTLVARDIDFEYGVLAARGPPGVPPTRSYSDSALEYANQRTTASNQRKQAVGVARAGTRGARTTAVVNGAVDATKYAMDLRNRRKMAKASTAPPGFQPGGQLGVVAAPGVGAAASAPGDPDLSYSADVSGAGPANFRRSLEARGRGKGRAKKQAKKQAEKAQKQAEKAQKQAEKAQKAQAQATAGLDTTAPGVAAPGVAAPGVGQLGGVGAPAPGVGTAALGDPGAALGTPDISGAARRSLEARGPGGKNPGPRRHPACKWGRGKNGKCKRRRRRRGSQHKGGSAVAPPPSPPPSPPAGIPPADPNAAAPAGAAPPSLGSPQAGAVDPTAAPVAAPPLASRELFEDLEAREFWDGDLDELD